VEMAVTDKELFAAVRALGLAIRKNVDAGEYRIAPKGMSEERTEALAYYTNDRDDALGTAKQMAGTLKDIGPTGTDAGK